MEEGKGVAVLDCPIIEPPVVNTEPESPVCLLCKQHRCASWGGGGPDESFIQIIFDPCPECLQFHPIQRVYGAEWGNESFLQGNGMVIWPVWRQLPGHHLIEEWKEIPVLLRNHLLQI